MSVENYIHLAPLISLLLGAIAGSFVLCLGDRLLNKENIFSSSHCPNCKTDIPAYALIPIISYVFLLGKCRFCKKKISFRYPLAEIFFAGLYFLIWQKVGLSLSLPVYLFCWSSFALIAFLDWQRKWFYTKILVLIFVASTSLLFLREIDFMTAFLGLTIGAGSFYFIAFFYYFITSKEGLGEGDISLLGVLGYFLGWQVLLPTVLYGSLGGIILGLLFFLEHGKNTPFPFTPPLILGAFLHWYYPDLYIKITTLWVSFPAIN